MSDVGSCGKLQRCAHVVRSCWELQRSDCSGVEKCLLNDEIANLAVESSQEQDKFLSEKQNLHDYQEREVRRALQGE